jgi:hypothetical protein
MDFKLFKEVAIHLKQCKLATYPLSIRRTQLKCDLDGQCELQKELFVIKINKKLTEYHAIDVVIHEVAHAVAWEKDKDIHGPNWGKAYAKVYRIFLNKFVE